MKTNKSYTKRLRVTKNKKIVARTPGQNHFNARADSDTRTRKRGTHNLALGQRVVRRFLPNH